MVAQQCNLGVGDFVWSGGDTHLYSNHVEQAITQLKRDPMELATLEIKRKPKIFFSYEAADFEFKNYSHHAAIRRQFRYSGAKAGQIYNCWNRQQ